LSLFQCELLQHRAIDGAFGLAAKRDCLGLAKVSCLASASQRKAHARPRNDAGGLACQLPPMFNGIWRCVIGAGDVLSLIINTTGIWAAAGPLVRAAAFLDQGQAPPDKLIGPTYAFWPSRLRGSDSGFVD
jgi:hypothetical protein